MTIGVRLWWTATLEPIDPSSVLDAGELVRWARYRQADDRKRFALGRLLAKTALAAELNCDAADIVIAPRCAVCGSDEHGKPRVAGHDALGLSIAHAHQRVLVAVAPGCEVGVDVERIRPVDDLIAPPAGVLRAEEREALMQLPAERHPWAFMGYWTRKEALLKASGEGLTVPLEALGVSGPGDRAAILEGPPSLPCDRVWTQDLEVGEEYRGCLALLLPEHPQQSAVSVEERRLTADDLAAAARSFKMRA